MNLNEDLHPLICVGIWYLKQHSQRLQAWWSRPLLIRNASTYWEKEIYPSGYTPKEGRWNTRKLIIIKTCITWYRVLGAGALGWPRGMGWGGRWEVGSGWGTYVHPWRIQVNGMTKPTHTQKKTKPVLLKANLKLGSVLHVFFLLLRFHPFTQMSPKTPSSQAFLQSSRGSPHSPAASVQSSLDSWPAPFQKAWDC